jgi:excisionase family DNA binding protein
MANDGRIHPANERFDYDEVIRSFGHCCKSKEACSMITNGQPSLPELFEPLASAEEAAVHLRIHVKTLRRLAREGQVPCARIGKYYRFRLSELDHWVRENHNVISRPFRVDTGDDLEVHA